MSLPLWDAIELPPDFTLMDINSIEDDEFRQQMQAEALALWVEELGADWETEIVREWGDDEGMFLVCGPDEEVLGVSIIWNVSDV